MSDEPSVALTSSWNVSNPESYYDSIQVAGTAVAPILAGFAFAVLAVVLSPAGEHEVDPFRWRDGALALLVSSALVLIISTQAGIRARATLVKPDELRAWYPSWTDPIGRPTQPLLDRQAALDEQTRRSTALCRHAYNGGTMLFFTAVAVLLVPPSPVDGARQAVLAVAVGAIGIEAAWLTGTSLRQLRRIERLPTLLAPLAYAVTAMVLLLAASTFAARAAAACSIAISGFAAATAGIRLLFRGANAGARGLGTLLLVGSIVSGAATYGLLSDRSSGTTFAWAAAVLIVACLAIAVIGSGLLPER